MTRVSRLLETALYVDDVDRASEFYERVLGFDVVHRQDQDNEYTRRLVGYRDASLRVAQLRVPGQPHGVSTHDLELVEYVVPRGEPYRGADRHRPGASHLALAVSDAWAEHARLVAAGVRFVSDPQEILAGVNRGGLCCYFSDPDDITLELVQPPVRR